jgi:hypothetical protein
MANASTHNLKSIHPTNEITRMSDDKRYDALSAAVITRTATSTPDEVVAAAALYLAFLATDTTVTVAPKAEKVSKPKLTSVPTTATTVAPAVQTVSTPQPTSVPTTATTVAPAVQTVSTPQPTIVPPPTTIIEVAASLKALVQDTAPGRGRPAAVALLAEFGVSNASQLAPAKLAEFKQRIDNAGKGAAPAAATDPMHGLI